MVTVPDNINGKEVRIVYADAFNLSGIRKIIISKKVYFDTAQVLRAKVSIEYK